LRRHTTENTMLHIHYRFFDIVQHGILVSQMPTIFNRLYYSTGANCDRKSILSNKKFNIVCYHEEEIRHLAPSQSGLNRSTSRKRCRGRKKGPNTKTGSGASKAPEKSTHFPSAHFWAPVSSSIRLVSSSDISNLVSTFIQRCHVAGVFSKNRKCPRTRATGKFFTRVACHVNRSKSSPMLRTTVCFNTSERREIIMNEEQYQLQTGQVKLINKQ